MKGNFWLIRYFGGFQSIPYVSIDHWVDVDTGSGNLTSFFISANLTTGDALYNSICSANQVINETVPRTYLSEVRDTNEINITSYSGSNMTMLGDLTKWQLGVLEGLISHIFSVIFLLNSEGVTWFMLLAILEGARSRRELATLEHKGKI